MSAGGDCRKARTPGWVSQAVGTHQDHCGDSELDGKCAGIAFISSLTCFGPGSCSPPQILGVRLVWVWPKLGDGGVVSGGTKALREAQVECHL